MYTGCPAGRNAFVITPSPRLIFSSYLSISSLAVLLFSGIDFQADDDDQDNVRDQKKAVLAPLPPPSAAASAPIPPSRSATQLQTEALIKEFCNKVSKKTRN